ncbi:MAG: hypothetical protein WC607_04275 [Candidatus Micrarchaeia archaeon]
MNNWKMGAEWKVMLGAALVAAGAMLAWKGQGTLGIAGTALLVMGVIVLLRAKTGKIIIDERVKQSSNKAYAYAWYSTFLLVAILIWADIFWPGSITVQGILSLLLFFMSASGIAFKWWFDQHPQA